jgi:acetate kinase
MPNAILALNAGSSSIKFGLSEIPEANNLRLASKGEIEGISTAPHFIARDRS